MIGLYLFDKNQDLIKSINPKYLTENKQEKELNGLISSQATIKYDFKDEEIYNKASYFGQKEEENFWLYKIRSKNKQNGLLTLVGVHILFDDLKGRIIRDMRPTNSTPAVAMSQILNGTGWSIGLSSAYTITSARFYHTSVLSSFSEILDQWNCEFVPKIIFSNGKIISKKINLYNKISNDYGKWFEYGDKLIDVIAEENHDIYTAFIGLGKGLPSTNDEGEATGGYGRKIKFTDVSWSTQNGKPVNKPKGQDYVEIKEATELFGYPDGSPKIGFIDFPNLEDEEELLEATYNYAVENCRPKVQLKSKAVSKDPVELGEVCAIIRSDLNIRYKTRIFKITKDFLNPELVDFEFGDKVVLSASDRAKQIEKDTLQKDKILESELEKILKSIINSYFNEDGYNYDLRIGNEYKLPAGYYSFDRPIDKNPTKVIYMGAGKLLIANQKTPTGEWNWRTALDGNGIVADSITTGSFNADLIKTGTLKVNSGAIHFGSLENMSANISNTELSANIQGQETQFNANNPAFRFDYGIGAFTTTGNIDVWTASGKQSLHTNGLTINNGYGSFIQDLAAGCKLDSKGQLRITAATDIYLLGQRVFANGYDLHKEITELKEKVSALESK